MENINIVSFGGGQNSPPMVEVLKGRINEVIFANVGYFCERPETYVFLKIFIKWCKDHNVKFTMIDSPYGNIYDYYYSKNLIPYRMFRSCTHRFKIIPINRYIKENYPNQVVNMNIGISSDESQRSVKFKDTKLIRYKFPLLDKGIDRDNCVKIIKDRMKLPVPVKSGCFFCPFQTPKAWAELFNDHPFLFNKCIEFEQNCKEYPNATLLGTRKLVDLKNAILTQSSLLDFEEFGLEKCVYCHG